VALRLRKIIEEDSFQESKGAVSKDVALLDDVMHGVTWTLAHSPEVGLPIDDPTVWAITTMPLLGMPAVIVYYCFDEREVRLLSVETTEWPDES